jgi:CRISPR-associated endonuclease/helicase Cas3
MASDTTPPSGATRFIQTTRGLLSYAQLAPLLAERVLMVEQNIAQGMFGSLTFSPELFLELHRRTAGDLCPEWAGRWRNAEVRVGEHHPPSPHRVPLLMHDYTEDLRVRTSNATCPPDEMLLEHLAFAEARLLSIHPFLDFNGRVTRLFLRELLRRLELPPVDLVPTDPAATMIYHSALRAGDRFEWGPLITIWKQRFEQFNDSIQ